MGGGVWGYLDLPTTLEKGGGEAYDGLAAVGRWRLRPGRLRTRRHSFRVCREVGERELAVAEGE